MPLRAAMPASVMKPTIAGDRQRLAGQPQRRDRADQRQRHAAHDDQRQHGRAVAAVEHREDQRERHQRQQPDRAAGLLLRLERAFEARGEALRQLACAELRADRGDDAPPCRPPSRLASTTMRRRPFSRRIWLGPSVSSTSAIWRAGIHADGRLDQEVAELLAWCDAGRAAASRRRSAGSRRPRARRRARSTAAPICIGHGAGCTP